MTVSTPTPIRRAAALVLPGMLAGLAFCIAGAGGALAAGLAVDVSIKDHKFQPAILNVPAGTAIKLTVRNLDDTPEVFQSPALKIDETVAGKQTIVIELAPLEKGSYPFFGAHHAETAKGELNADQAEDAP